MRFNLCLALVLSFVIGCEKAEDTATDSSVPASSAVFNVTGAPTVQFKVPDMMCEESCAKAVHDTLAAQPGVKEVVVDFPNRLATVAVDKVTFDSQTALDALLDKQFSEATLVETDNSDADTESDNGL